MLSQWERENHLNHVSTSTLLSTNLAAGVLAGFRTAFPPLMGAGAGALVTATATNLEPPLTCCTPLFANLMSQGSFTPAGWVMDCLAASLVLTSTFSCHHFCSEQTGNGEKKLNSKRLH